MLPKELATNKTGVAEETDEMALAGKYPPRKTPLLYVGSVRRNDYFIHVDITEDVVKSVARKLSGSLGPGGMDLESLQVWLLNLRRIAKDFVLVLILF